jgi:hypothetical protein
MKPEKKASRARKTSAVEAANGNAKTPKPRARRTSGTQTTAAKSAPASSQATRSPRKPAAPKKTLEVPPILLEGDQPAGPTISGPGQRYALGPTPPPEHSGATGESGELPEAYGTRKLLLTARDPHWLYAHWDLTREQLRQYNARSADRHLVLRVYVDAVNGKPLVEVHVHPESRNWFVHVGRGNTRFLAELGYYRPDRQWVTIVTSSPTLTPPDALSPDTSVHFATIPVDVPFEQLLALVKTAAREHVPLAEAILQLRASGYEGLPSAPEIGRRWTPEQERALAGLISMDSVRRVWIGSLEITELIRRQLLAQISSAAVAQFSVPTSPARAAGSVSSPFGGLERQKGFWFNINAELIIYGATERNAKVTIGGREIKLRPDGSFSFRFALPDGKYELPVVAISADQTDGRAAELEFSRSTEYRGEVGVHPQDPRLRPPRVEKFA